MQLLRAVPKPPMVISVSAAHSDSDDQSHMGTRPVRHAAVQFADTPFGAGAEPPREPVF